MTATRRPRATRDAYRERVLAMLEAIWTSFREKFLDLWREQSHGRCLSRRRSSRGRKARARLEAERQAYMDRLWADTVGFAAAKMIRRILGLAHNIDLELDRGQGPPRHLRGPRPDAGPRHDGEHRKLSLVADVERRAPLREEMKSYEIPSPLREGCHAQHDG